MAWKPTRTFAGGALLCGALALLVGLLTGTPASGYPAGGKPTATKLFLSKLDGRSATVAAVVDPEGSETAYQFWLEYSPCADCTAKREAVAQGELTFAASGYSGAYGSWTVSTKLRKLTPAVSYTVWAVASNPTGSASTTHETFELSTTGEERSAAELRAQEEEELPLPTRMYLLEKAEEAARQNADPEPKSIEAVKAVDQSNETPPESTSVYIVRLRGHFVCEDDLQGGRCGQIGKKPIKGSSMSLTFEAETLRQIGFGIGKTRNTLADRGLTVVLSG